MNRNVSALAAIVACACIQGEARAQYLGSASSFGVLGGSTVTNTGPTTVVGDVGVSPGTAITGFPPGVVTGGAIHANDALAIRAHSDAAAGYTALAALAPTRDLTGQNLGGLTLTPGVYHFASSAQLTGTLTLDAQGQANPLFVFQIGSTLTTASASSIVEVNGGDPCNVFFQVGSSATLGTGTMFTGSIIAAASDTLTTGASVNGSVVALSGAVTLDSNVVMRPLCAVPEPSTIVMTATAALAGLGFWRFRRRRAA